MKQVPVVPVAVLSLTLGLAPFVPEPHIVGKLRWVLGGAEGMEFVDWFDLVLHGAPWVGLSIAFTQQLLHRMIRAKGRSS